MYRNHYTKQVPHGKAIRRQRQDCIAEAHDNSRWLKRGKGSHLNADRRFDETDLRRLYAVNPIIA
jgi:hypothetical protein